MKVKDILGCVGWGALILLSSAWIPFFGPFLSLLAPLPFLYYASKLGTYEGLKLAAVATLTIGLFAKLIGSPQIIIFCIEFSLLGLALSELFKRKLSLGQTIFFGTAFMLLLGLGFLFFLALSKGMGPFEMTFNYLETQLKATLKIYEEMGKSQGNAGELGVYGKAFVAIILKIYPSLMIVGIGFAVWLNVVVAKPLFRMGNLGYPAFAPTDHWHAPDSLVWGVIVAGFALFFQSERIELLAINGLIILMVIYLFHGLSIVLFFLNKYHVPSWLRIGVYILIVVQQLFFIALSLAGLFDQWVDFRKIHRRMES
jgi:uncharacterized protein YybS (DUF2232 family)